MDEPGIGVHLGLLVPQLAQVNAFQVRLDQMLVTSVRGGSHDYFFSDQFRTSWEPPLRSLILARVRAHILEACERQEIDRPIIVLKEPNGSQAANLLLSVLPRSRLIFLMRDPRDVLDSALDATRPGSWLEGYGMARGVDDEDRLAFLRDRAQVWLLRTHAVHAAYRTLPPEQRILVRYEDLLDDTAGVLNCLFGWLGVEMLRDLDAAVERLSVSAVPEHEKGPGKFVRSARAGTWREGLTEREQSVLGELLGPALNEFGYVAGSATSKPSRS